MGVQIKKTGFFNNFLNSVGGIFIGILLIFGSMVLLFFNEVRPNAAQAAIDSVELTSFNAADVNGKGVWSLGALTSNNIANDTDYLHTQNWLVVDRTVEMYAYIEHSETETYDEIGGGTTQKTTYTYTLEWTSDPQDSSKFYEKQHVNPNKSISDRRFVADDITINGYGISGGTIVFDGLSQLNLNTEILINSGNIIDNNYLYLDLNTGTVTDPKIGDYRIIYKVLCKETVGIVLAKLDGNNLVPLDFESTGVIKVSSSIYRFFDADTISEVIEQLQYENRLLLWILRFLGFSLIMAGFAMIMKPIHIISKIIPFVGRLSKFLINILSFVLALILTLLVCILANVINNIFTLIILIAIFVLLIALGIKKAKSKKVTG